MATGARAPLQEGTATPQVSLRSLIVQRQTKSKLNEEKNRVANESPAQRPEAAPIQTVPRADFVHIEYPGLIGAATADPCDGAKDSLAVLDKALITLAPQPPPYGNPGSALEHLGRIISLKSKVIECRPWALDHFRGSRSEGPNRDCASQEDLPTKGSQLDLFRHPLPGEIVETHNIIVAVRRRVWRKRRKPQPDAACGLTSKSQDQVGQDFQWIQAAKEYTVEPLGVARTTARWRKMADFLYEPDLGGPSTRGSDRRGDTQQMIDVPSALRLPTSSTAASDLTEKVRAADGSQSRQEVASPCSAAITGVNTLQAQVEQQSIDRDVGDVVMHGLKAAPSADVPRRDRAKAANAKSHLLTKPRGGLLSLYDALVRMDVRSLRSFSMPEEKGDYDVELADGSADGKTDEISRLSNLRMVPPPAFTRVELPHTYAFRQPANSSIETWEKIHPDGSRTEVKRWANNSRWQGMSPHEWFLGSAQPVPSKPPAQVARQRTRCDCRLLQRLERLFTERPVWTRAALLNQFDSADDRKNINFTKEYLPLVSYAIRDGAFSATYVRLGFDVRKNPESRFYQILKFQTPDRKGSPGRARFSKAYGGAHASGAGAKIAQHAQAGEDGQDLDSQRHSSENVPGAEGAASNNSLSSSLQRAGLEDNNDEQEFSDPQRSHIFDGEHKPGRNPSFILADVIDPLARPYIEVQGPENILASPSAETGWYTSLALERIRAVVGVRFHKLHTEGRSATAQEVADAVAMVSLRQARNFTAAAAVGGRVSPTNNRELPAVSRSTGVYVSHIRRSPVLFDPKAMAGEADRGCTGVNIPVVESAVKEGDAVDTPENGDDATAVASHLEEAEDAEMYDGEASPPYWLQSLHCRRRRFDGV